MADMRGMAETDERRERWREKRGREGDETPEEREGGGGHFNGLQRGAAPAAEPARPPRRQVATPLTALGSPFKPIQSQRLLPTSPNLAPLLHPSKHARLKAPRSSPATLSRRRRAACLLTNYIALYYFLTNWLLQRLMEGSSDQRSQIVCFKFSVLELISSTLTCIRKPTDSHSRKAWILSCSDNDNLGVTCKNTTVQGFNQVQLFRLLTRDDIFSPTESAKDEPSQD
ncbi:uncharacterized protein [Triticum aestivum]|uniref:uncharacterized protein isoform X2 n=1 Tax=Triticum aestivum TaxID=4565 RepID=UPI001D01DFD7|nr:uncharacterized protein LOC123105829 isoform X2 [Triticum aestivum]